MTTTPDTFTNYATSTVAGGAGGIGSNLAAGDTTLFVQAGDGAKYPSVAPFMLQLGTVAPFELAKCTSRSGDVLTIVRGQEGTAAATWAVGVTVEQVATAGNLANLWAASPQVFNVLAYGAKGNGTTDDTSAIQAAITACQNNGGGVVFFPAGTYFISATLNITTDNVHLAGAGWGSQLLASASFSGSYMLYVQSLSNFRYGIRIQELFFNGNSVAALGGLNLESTYHCVLDHVRVRYCGAISVFWNGVSGKFGAYNHMRDCTVTDGTTASSIGVKTQNSEWLVIEGCDIITFTTAGAYGVNLNNLNCTVIGSRFDNIDTALYMSFSSRCLVSGCQFDRAFTRFINLRGNQSSIITGCSFNTRSGSGTEVIYVNDGNNQTNTITDCTVEPSNGGWTYFINESGNTGGPGNIYTGNTTAGLKLALVTGTGRSNIGVNPVTPLVAPSAPTVNTAATGGTIPAGTYNVEVTYVNAYGETAASASTPITTTGATSTITITAPPQRGNAVGWYAYVTQAGGGSYTRQQAAGASSQFANNLTLTATPSSGGATAPVSNTTAGFSQPAIPASGAVFANPVAGVDCMVYINGGTVSAIAVGGQTLTGVTSGAVRVPAYGSITLTYSAAPTWTWIGD